MTTKTATANPVRFLDIDESSEGQRLDNFLLKTLKGVPKSLIYRIIRKGEVRVNKGRAKPETRLDIGDVVRVPPVRARETGQGAKPSEQLLSTLDSAVLYESDSLIIINKPSGLAVHGGSGINLGLIEALRSSDRYPGFLELVHRLDRDTSGCVMVAKKRSMLKYLQDLLRTEGSIQKSYMALVQDQWPAKRKLVDVPLLKREARNGERFVEVNHATGKSSRTRFRVMESFRDATLVEAKPMTGRTHQIRVHAKYVGHPLIGDDKYGTEQCNKAMRGKGIKRLFLHASRLEVPLPDGERIDIRAALPDDLERGLRQLRKGV